MKNITKSYILVFLLFVGALLIMAVACNPSDGEEPFKVERDENGNEYVLSEDKDGYDLKYVCVSEEESVTVPEHFNGLPVKSVLANSFRNCSRVKNISVPNGINVKGLAFFGCSSLETLTIPDINYGRLGQLFGTRYFDGTQKTDHDLYGTTSKVYYIPRSLKSVTLTNASNLYSRVFSNCQNLVSIEILGSVDTVGVCAFADCTSLKNLSLPASIKEIDTSGMADCTSLEHIDLPQNLTRIGMLAFKGDKALKDIVIPDSVRALGLSAFLDCTGLKNITIGSGMAYINKNAFAHCRNVENLYFNAKNTEDFSNDAHRIFAELGKNTAGTKVYIGSTVEKVPAYMLFPHNEQEYCPNVTEIVFAENSNCAIIGEYAFSFLRNLKSVTLADGLETIGNSAFCQTNSLERITIPKTVTKILSGAFIGSKALEEIEFEEAGNWKVYTTSTDYVSVSVKNSVANVNYFTDKYRRYDWEKT